MKSIITCLLLSCSVLVFGQELVFTTPVPLSSAVNTSDEELAPMLSPDGKTLYFIRAFHEGNNGGKFAGTDIWVSRKNEQGQWIPASRMDNTWNNKRSNAVIGINADQSVVYLLNAYTNKSGISFSKYFSGQWGIPEFIPVPGINRDDFVGFYVNPQFDVILISMKGKDTLGEEDIYLSLKDSSGNWTEPRNLGPTINTSGFEISPFLSHDKKRLYFSSNGHEGLGDADIFYCDRLFDSWETWSVPKNLGSGLNSPLFDGYYSQYDSMVTFVSNRQKLVSADIYEAKIVLASQNKRDTAEVIFLSSEEVRKIFGDSFSSAIVFEKDSDSIALSEESHIANMCKTMAANPKLKLHLTARREKNSVTLEINKLRLFNLLELIKRMGIEGSRVTFGSEILSDYESVKQETVLLRFLY